MVVQEMVIMKILMENWRKYVNETIKITIGKAKDLICPPATQDLELNTRNRNSAIEAEHIQYGPLNLADEKYWDRAAEHWKTTPDVAKKSRCSNCVAFDISPRMDECLPGPVEDEDGRLGYCWMHHFIQARTGHEVYERFCISCHNYDGRGASRETNLFADRRRLRTADTELLTSILDGKGEMPGYSNVLTYEEAQNVLQYIRENLKRR